MGVDEARKEIPRIPIALPLPNEIDRSVPYPPGRVVPFGNLGRLGDVVHLASDAERFADVIVLPSIQVREVVVPRELFRARSPFLLDLP